MVLRQIFTLTGLLFILQFSNLQAQQTDSIKNNLPKVYIDCSECDMAYTKDHITFVNYVRERREADLHILATGSETGSGGFKVILIFYGQNRFAGKTDTLSFSVGPSTSDEIVKEKLIKVLKLGILSFMTESKDFDNFDISYKATEGKSNQVSEEEDPWNYWIFKTSLNGWYNGESSYQNYNFNTRLSANRITKDWKLEFDLNNSYNEHHYHYGNDEIIGITRSYYFNHALVKSLTDHWSVGYYSSAYSSSYSNINYSFSLKPAVEYDVYPYSQSTIKQFRIRYTIGPSYKNYIDTTIFNKTKELLFHHTLEIAYETNQKWGNIGFNISTGSYLHDFSLNSTNFSSNMSLNLFKGFSLYLYGSISFIHDQIELTKEDASLESVLIHTQQLPTSFSYYASVGFSYTFGSIYNNVVNPRFD